jgi:hypothetical protein
MKFMPILQSHIPPIHGIGFLSLSHSIPCPLQLHMTPSTFIQHLGPRKIISLVMETLDESHISVPLENREDETEIKQGNLLFQEHFRRLHIARPDVFYPKSRGHTTPYALHFPLNFPLHSPLSISHSPLMHV